MNDSIMHKINILNETQFGFRKARNIACALFIVKEIIDTTEEGFNTTMLLLDWETSFDRISRDRVMEALVR